MTPNEETQPITNIKPCHHMEQAISSLSDGSLTGVSLWYTRLHVSGCKQCSTALTAFQSLRKRLGELHSADANTVPIALSETKRQSLEDAMEEVENR